MPSYSLRPATEADTDPLFWIHRASMTEYLIQALGDWPEEYAREQHLAWIREGRAQTVTVGGEVVGSIDVAWAADGLHINAHNPARLLYERLGFRETGRSGPSIAMEWQPLRDLGRPPARQR